MLTSVTVVPPPGAFWSSLTIPVQASDGSGIFIEKIDGLEPVQAEITTNGYNEQDGEFFVGSRVSKRNIVLHLVLEALSSTISELRRNLYGYFMPKMNLVLQFNFTDRDPVQIEGYVESFEGDRWSQEVNPAISIICPKPNFREVPPGIVVTGDSEYGSPLPLTDVLNFGDRSVGGQINIVNNMAEDFSGDIYIDRLIESSPGVYYSTQQIYLAGVFLQPSSFGGQHIWIDTNQGQKKIELQFTDPSQNVSLMGRMADDSDWLRFDPAVNLFRVVTTGTTGWAGNHLDWTLTVVPQYGAI